MKESTQQLMLNAEETLHAAEILFKEEYLRDAINRAYYAVFYIAEALLNEKDLRYSKHGTVHGRAWDFLKVAKEYLASLP